MQNFLYGNELYKSKMRVKSWIIHGKIHLKGFARGDLSLDEAKGQLLDGSISLILACY